MSRSTVLLARAAARELRAAECKDEGELWTKQEAKHAAARTQTAALRAAKPLLKFCSECPVVQACETWARLDRYTGIAAGQAWEDGKATPSAWVPGHPPRSLAS